LRQTKKLFFFLLRLDFGVSCSWQTLESRIYSLPFLCSDMTSVSDASLIIFPQSTAICFKQLL
jgi:hypothetical protein